MASASVSASGGRECGGSGAGAGGDTGDGGGGGERGGGRESENEFLVGGSGGFVFGRKDEITGRKSSHAVPGGLNMRQREMPSSYRDKLLSPGMGGYLVKHDVEEDIVKGWKAYFNQMNQKDDNREAEESEGEEVGEGIPNVKTPRLQVTAEEYADWCRPWLNSLIIKVLGANIPTYIIKDRINRMWRPQDPIKTIPLSNGYHIVSFTTKEDRDYAFQEGPWMIDDHYVLVQRWRPNFNPWKADHQRKIAAWVRLPDLPMELYSVESLRRIGNMIGRTIKIDRSTSIYDKGGFARICVEINLQQPLLPNFWAFGEDHPIVYEGLHSVCFLCGKYGHQQQACPLHKEKEMSAKREESRDGMKKPVNTEAQNQGKEEMIN